MRHGLLALLLLAPAGRAAATDLRFPADAPLRAVQFVNPTEGWAVGDEGAVWQTIDGGRTWERQKTGSRASLRSLAFVTPHVGWVVGREELPGGGSAGVLLFTRDGGATWQKLLPNSLPGLNQVRFVDPRTGFLLGDGNDHLPSGVFKTTDGGRNWEPVPGPRTTAWLAADFQDGTTGLLAGAWSRLATLKGDQFTAAADVDTLAGRHVTGLRIVPGRVLAVAQGGLLLTSASGGARWGFAKLNLPPDVIAALDFAAIHAVGKKVWVVGRPGSVVLASDDAGDTWQVQRTGQPLPLHGVFFFNDRLGWAVGDAGTILATQDGGKTWAVQRQGGTRAAALVVHGHDLPADALTQLGACDGYLTAALRVVAADPASAAPHRAAEAPRHAAAVRAAGGFSGETLWQFPLPQHLEAADKKQLLAHWDRRHADRAGHELLRQLVLALRVWRPSVVLAEHPDGPAALPGLVGEAVHEAVKQAADPKAFPEQLDALGLAPWTVGKLYGAADRGGAVVFDNGEPRPGLRASAREYAADAARLLGDGGVPARRTYRLVHSNYPGAEDVRHPMLGLSFDVGDTRRKVEAAEEPDAKVMAAIRQRNALIAYAESVDHTGKLMLLVPSLARLPDDEHAAPTLYAVATACARSGQWALAQEAFELLTAHHPGHPLTAEAQRWLVRHAGSGEARRRHERKQFLQVSTTVTAPKSGEPQDVVQPAVALEAVTAGKRATIGDRAATDRRCVALGKELASFGPLYAADPAAQFCVQAARRSLGETDRARDWYTKFRKYVPAGPWHDAATAELWHAGGNVPPPRRQARARLTGRRPYLDGKFDDACWEGQKPLVLADAVGDSAAAHRTEARFAYDQEFLYVALHCRHPQGGHVAPVKGRSRDADLDAFDRVSLLLDLDRDYATYYRLEVDQRGGVREDCWGDRTWDPRWFVAVQGDADGWRVEAAIPLGELTSERVALGQAWAFNVVRTLPGRGVQSWSQPADVRPRPEGMSLLVFQQDANRAPAAAPMAPAR